MYVRDALLSEPITTTPDETFESLIGRLATSRQATAAVLDPDGKLLGLIGIHDILRKIVPHYLDLDSALMEVMPSNYFEEHLDRLRGMRVEQFMCTKIDSVTPEDTLIKAVVLVVEKRRKTLPVLDHGRFVGMITRRSILEFIVKQSTVLP